MVTINRVNDSFQFEVKGLHKIWAFKSQITVPVSDIVSVSKSPDNLNGLETIWKGLRLLGTYSPFLIMAGTYFKNGKKMFWDVVNSKKSIVIELKDSSYSRLIIEVENPEEAMPLLQA